MAQEIVTYVSNHPKFFIGLGILVCTFAGLGLWYVIYHHLQVIIITVLCASGIVSGGVVFYRGVSADMSDLIGIGAFLILIFPIIFIQAIRLSYAEPPPPKSPDKPLPRKVPAMERQ